MINSPEIERFSNTINKIAEEYSSNNNRFFKIMADEEKIEFLTSK